MTTLNKVRIPQRLSTTKGIVWNTKRRYS